MPAANPPPCLDRSTDGSIYSLSEWAHLRVFGKLFWHPWGSFSESILKSFVVVLGCVMATLGSPGAPKESGLVCGSFVGPSPGPPLLS